MANTPKQVQKGIVKFPSIKAAAEAAGIPYMTFYMRMRNGKSASKAYHTKVRKYTKRSKVVALLTYQPGHDGPVLTLQ
jgi:hypothetical protein